MKVTVDEAKVRLSKLLDLVAAGRKVVIVRNGEPVARLVPASGCTQRQLGTMVGEIRWKEDWDRPMTDREVDDFLLGRG
jgi:prevent-host-death family protein